MKELIKIDCLRNELTDIIESGELIWQRGWAEANAGNVSIRIPEECNSFIEQFIIKKGMSQSIKSYHKNDIVWIIISASGTRFRDFKKNGMENFILSGFILSEEWNKIPSDCCSYPLTRKPSSEWMTHLLLHNWLRQNRKSQKIILHTHITDWIILSNLIGKQVSIEHMERKIRDYLPELDLYFPQAIQFVGPFKSGSMDLAKETLGVIKQSNIIVWEKHGIIVIAENASQAFDYLEIMSKAARVYLEINKDKRIDSK